MTMRATNERYEAFRIAARHADPRRYSYSRFISDCLAAAAKDIPEAFVILPDDRPRLFDHDAFDEWIWRTVAPYWGA